ncbi:ThiF family adenylyltransferase [Patescibacteria group bacterium]|nr:ThiF family adenylyltransferase [Patescibacteria group bacterium]
MKSQYLVQIEQLLAEKYSADKFKNDTAEQSVLPFWTALKELEQLRQMSQAILAGSLGQLEPQLAALVQETEQQQDLEWFAQHCLTFSDPEQIASNANWLWNEAKTRKYLYLGSEQHWLVCISRCLGLIRLATLRRLRQTKICVFGASVAASSIELLADLGCAHIRCIDDGVVDPSNLPRLPMATVFQLGQPKAVLLAERLRQRHPYGKFDCLIGRVVAHQDEKKHANQVVATEFIRDADIIIEVIDDIRMKSIIHTTVLSNFPDIPLIFVADLGTEPVVKVVQANEKGKVERPFGRTWTGSERSLLEKAQHSLPLSRYEVQRLAYLMVKESLPPEHMLQFLLNCEGVMPFWSQTPIASRLSAAQVAVAVLELLGGVTTSQLPSLQPNIAQLSESYFRSH